MMKHIFLSYAREDKEFAQRLNKGLRASHQIPWQDRINLLGGDNYQVAIDRAIRTAEALVLIISPDAINSHSAGAVARPLGKALTEPTTPSLTGGLLPRN